MSGARQNCYCWGNISLKTGATHFQAQLELLSQWVCCLQNGHFTLQCGVCFKVRESSRNKSYKPARGDHEALESVMSDVIKIRLIHLFLEVSFPTSPFIPQFQTYFFDVTHDTFQRFMMSSKGLAIIYYFIYAVYMD